MRSKKTAAAAVAAKQRQLREQMTPVILPESRRAPGRVAVVFWNRGNVVEQVIQWIRGRYDRVHGVTIEFVDTDLDDVCIVDVGTDGVAVRPTDTSWARVFVAKYPSAGHDFRMIVGMTHDRLRGSWRTRAWRWLCVKVRAPLRSVRTVLTTRLVADFLTRGVPDLTWKKSVSPQDVLSLCETVSLLFAEERPPCP